MSDTPTRDASGPSAGDAPRSDASMVELRVTVVEYDGRPDRATVHPPGLTGDARAVTWFSIDAGAVVDLAAWR